MLTGENETLSGYQPTKICKKIATFSPDVNQNDIRCLKDEEQDWNLLHTLLIILILTPTVVHQRQEADVRIVLM